MAKTMRESPLLVKRKLVHVCVMGGLSFDETNNAWEPDAAVNNAFDVDAARVVYNFCFDQEIKLSVVSRNAVPHLPMDMVRNFAAKNPSNPIFQYLARSQQEGLVGLWDKLCNGELPKRCDKSWYMRTFCGYRGDSFSQKELQKLDVSTDIAKYLNGSIKPYDVCAFMLTLPNPIARFGLKPKIYCVSNTEHMLYLDDARIFGRKAVMDFLESAFESITEDG